MQSYPALNKMSSFTNLRVMMWSVFQALSLSVIFTTSTPLPEELPCAAGLHGVDGAGLEVGEDGARHPVGLRGGHSVARRHRGAVVHIQPLGLRDGGEVRIQYVCD